jgi:hypothetical protein
LPQQWKEPVAPIYKKCNKTDSCNYKGISLLSTTYRILSNISSRFILCAYEIDGCHRCGFRSDILHFLVPGALSLGVKRPGREADHSPPSSAKIKE